MRSVVRDEVLGYHVDPSDTGDLAYRATFPKDRVEALDSSLVEPSLRCWLGPEIHAVLYPVRNGNVYNLVLLYVTRGETFPLPLFDQYTYRHRCPDDMPPGVATSDGNLQEMRDLFKGWDPR